MPFKSLSIAILLGILSLTSGVAKAMPTAAAPPRHIEVDAKKFEFAPALITVKKGEPVVLVLKSVDVAHGVRFKDLGIDASAAKGQTREINFTPQKTGTFVGHCSVFCGSGHGAMTLTIQVVE